MEAILLVLSAESATLPQAALAGRIVAMPFALSRSSSPEIRLRFLNLGARSASFWIPHDFARIGADLAAAGLASEAQQSDVWWQSAKGG